MTGQTKTDLQILIESVGNRLHHALTNQARRTGQAKKIKTNNNKIVTRLFTIERTLEELKQLAEDTRQIGEENETLVDQHLDNQSNILDDYEDLGVLVFNMERTFIERLKQLSGEADAAS